jgi:hypothetical protein
VALAETTAAVARKPLWRLLRVVKVTAMTTMMIVIANALVSSFTWP